MAEYAVFTKEMRKDYTILTPNMLPLHFELIMQVLRNEGYRIEVLQNSGPKIAETGLRYVHNDACYPAVLVVGQLIDALESGLYDPHRVALIMSQTGGGCRASNYIYLIRKALEKAGFAYIPVISFNLSGLEQHPGFQLTLPILLRMFFGVLYGDLIMLLRNQCRPYEKHPGESQALAEKLCRELALRMRRDKGFFLRMKATCREILSAFGAIPLEKSPKVRVGIVGEIYVKYSPLANNDLEDFLIAEGAEPVVPGLLDFCLYCIYNNIMDHRLYGGKPLRCLLVRLAYKLILQKQGQVIGLVKEHGRFDPPSPFDRTVERISAHIGMGTKMGEGWLLPGEMLELYDEGVKNIVCAQPFGCLPNHICGKGMMKPFRDAYPDMNIVAVDYDPGATRVNQENRLKLMLANGRQALGKG